MKSSFLLLFLTTLSVAHASLIRAPQFDADAASGGFGNIPRLLSISNSGQAQATSPSGQISYSNFYSGCVGVNGTTGAGVYGQCQGSDATIGPNGAFAPNSNNIASPPVLGTNQNNVATLGSLGITSLQDLVLIFNAIEPQNDTGGINLVDATIKFYSSTGTLLGSVDGNQNFTGTLSGNGNFGFAFQIDSAQRAALTAAFGSTSLSSIIIAMEGIVSNASGGADSFFVRSATGTVPDVPVPEPGSILLLSGGLALGACYAAIRKGRKAA